MSAWPHAPTFRDVYNHVTKMGILSVVGGSSRDETTAVLLVLLKIKLLVVRNVADSLSLSTHSVTYQTGA